MHCVTPRFLFARWGAYGASDLLIKWPKEPGKRLTSIALKSQNDRGLQDFAERDQLLYFIYRVKFARFTV
jgi:hypothetical protein